MCDRHHMMPAPIAVPSLPRRRVLWARVQSKPPEIVRKRCYQATSLSQRWVARQEFVDAAVRMAVDDLGDDVGEVGLRIDGIEFAAFDQGCGDCPMLGSAIGAGEERILPGLMLRSTTLQSISTRPSSTK